jgi:hypothetical protein
MFTEVCSLLASKMKPVGPASVPLMEAMRMQSSLKTAKSLM